MQRDQLKLLKKLFISCALDLQAKGTNSEISLVESESLLHRA